MITLGVATDFAGESKNTEEIRNTLKKIKNAGFTHVHWCHEWRSDYQYSLYEMQQLGEWFDEFNLCAKSLHASRGSSMSTVIRREAGLRRDYTSEDECSRKGGVEIVRNRMLMAHILGAKEIVLHMSLPYMTFKEVPGSETRFYRQVFKSLDELKLDAGELGVKICIENMLETPVSEQYRQFDLLFERYEKDFLGLCLDTGHANIILRDKMETFIKKYQDRIFSVHINDNLGGPSTGVYDNEHSAWACDMHMIPGDGNIDWRKLGILLSDTAYELPLVLELKCREEDQNAFLKRSYEAGKRLTERIMQHQNVQAVSKNVKKRKSKSRVR